MSGYIGKSLRRGEDDRFLRGLGSYTDDVAAAGAAHAAFVRSPHAHARIRAIDTAAAAAMPGVLRVLTAADWAAAGLGVLPCVAPVAGDGGRPMNEALRPVFAAEKVCHVGDTVAAVVAETRAQAQDAAEAVAVDYAPLAAVTDAAGALEPDAPVLHEAFGTNLCQRLEHGDAAATAAAFAGAHHVASLAFRHGRVTACPMEPRAYLGRYDPADGRYTLWSAAQNPHLRRRWLAERTLMVPLDRLRVIAADVGGGFGVKFYGYGEEPVVLWAARLLGRPVRWAASRSEAMLTDTHARDLVTRARMAFDRKGRILALRCETTAAYGAYISTFAPNILISVYPETITGMYRIPAVHVTVTGVYTNTSPIDAYRGVKQAPAFVHERLIDKGARALGLGAAEIRQRNYLGPGDYPYTNALGATYDSGDPPRQHETLRRLIDEAALRAEQARLKARGLRMGIGFAAVVESAGLGPSRKMTERGALVGGWEAVTLRVQPDGSVTLFAGTHSHGQSHEITFRQVAADALGLDIAEIAFSQGDTDLGPGNFGTGAARAISVAGVAVAEAGRRILAKASRLAAHLLECAEGDVRYGDGSFSIPGTDRRIGFARVAEMAYLGADYPEDGFELGLEATVFHDPAALNYPTALHLAVVTVDEETGAVTLRAYYTVDDCGRVINPMIVHGQVHGGLGQGIGQAMMEQVVFDPDSGQPLTGSFMDYAIPRAADLPTFALAFQETPSPTNPLGVKGCSETGIVGAPAALGNAVVDALADLGIDHIDMPYTPQRVWRAIRAARAAQQNERREP